MVSDGDGVGRQRGCSGEFVVMVIVVSSGNPTAAIVAEGLEASSSLVAVQGDSLGLVYPRPLLSVGCLGPRVVGHLFPIFLETGLGFCLGSSNQ